MSYSAVDVVGKIMYALERVPVKLRPWDDEPIYSYIEPGTPIGQVYTWLEPRDDRSYMYWEFHDPAGLKFYTPHLPGLYNLGKLRNQGLLTITEKQLIQEYEPWYKEWFSGDNNPLNIKKLGWLGIALLSGTQVLQVRHTGGKVALGGITVYALYQMSKA